MVLVKKNSPLFYHLKRVCRTLSIF